MQRPNTPKKILCIRLDNMGDVVLTTPAFRALHETFPKASLTLLTSESGAAISPYIPFIDKTISYSAPWVKNKGSSNDTSAIIEIIKKENFDMAIIFTNFSQNSLPSAMLCYLAEIPVRVGYCKENPYSLLTHWVVDKEPFSFILHGVKRQLDLVKAIGAQTSEERLVLVPSLEAEIRIDTVLRQRNIDRKKPFILIHPGASEEKRRYKVDFFAKAAQQLINAFDFEVGITGTQEEAHLLHHIHAVCKGKTILFPNLSVGELIALIKKSDILLSNNTGPVHIAAAVNTPVVVLYAQTNPEHTPWNVVNKVFYFPIKNEQHSKNQFLQIVPYSVPEKFTIDTVIASLQEILKKNSSTFSYSSEFDYQTI